MAKRMDLFLTFMDLEKAYGRVDRDAMSQVIRLYGMSDKLLKNFRVLTWTVRACIRIQNDLSDWFSVKVRVRQGCVMSPWLPNLYMDGVVREV